jgi:hypothetical protein
MPDESFHVHESKIYCAEHYQKLFSKPCSGCHQDISGQYLEVVGKYFHSHCWKCTMCSAHLENTGCTIKNDQFYCPPCVVKVPSQPIQLQPSRPTPAPTPTAAAAPAPKPAATPAAAPAPVQKPVATPAPAPPATTVPAKNTVALLETLHKEGDDISVEEMRKRLLEVSEKALAEANKEQVVEKYPVKDHYTLAELMNSDALPDCVDRTKKEVYLSDADFQGVFGMDKTKFAALKAWKQQELKKGAKIF